MHYVIMASATIDDDITWATSCRACEFQWWLVIKYSKIEYLVPLQEHFQMLMYVRADI